MVLCVADVKICQFWTKKWMDVPFLSFSVVYVLLMKKIKTDGVKNKVFKP
jgi:hypothetical protein